VATTMEEDMRGGDLGETTKCWSGRWHDLYRTPTFCHGSYSQTWLQDL
jgi:hypothetical protein